MVRIEEINLSVTKSDIRSLSVLRPTISIAAVFREWFIIAIAMALHWYFPYPVLYIFIGALIGTRMYALYSLLHDGMHYLLFPDRKVNDWICRLFLAWPLFLSLTRMRKAHLAHHQYLRTDQDPEAAHLKYAEFQFPQSAGQLAFTFLTDLTGINFLRYSFLRLGNRITSYAGKKKSNNKIPQDRTFQIMFIEILYYGVLCAVIIYMGWEVKFLLYWCIPYITIFQALNRLRLSTEHFNIPENRFFQTRTVDLNIFERFVFSPNNLGFHAEHHLYPSVPFYHLSELHRKLMASTEYKESIVINKSYLEVIKEYVK